MTRPVQRQVGVLAAILMLFGMEAVATDADQWSNLRTLSQGDRIGIVQSNQKRIEGRFVRSTDDGITVQADQEFTVGKQDVVRVYRRAGMRRMSRVLIGAGAGIAAGAILSGTVGERYRNEGADVPSGAWVGGGVAIGAAIGALTGSGYHEVYRKPPR